MARYNSWDIVTVPFPFTDGESEKRRPALIVSSEKLAEDHDFYWLVMITSAHNKSWETDIIIKDHAKAGLPAPSVIRPVKIATLQSDRIIKKLGAIDKSLQEKVRNAVTGMID
jgi:mRNA interferase MazF